MHWYSARMTHTLGGARPALYAFIGFVALTASCFATLPAAAAGSFQAFAVPDVPVDVTADTAAAARNIAIGEAQGQAFGMLLRRMTLKEDRGRLPRLDGNSVSSLVQSIEFSEERYSSTRYIAKVTVAFSPNGIRSLLQRNNIPFAEAPENPILVLPVFNGALGQANPWWNAWERQDWRENLLSFELPRDTASGGPSAAEIMQGAGPWLENIGRRHGTAEVLVAMATWDNSSSPLKLVVDLRRYGVAGETTQNVTFSQMTGETPEALLTRAARDIGSDITTEWKRYAMIGQGAQTQILAIMDLRSLQDLVAVRERLARAPMIKSASVESMNTHRAMFNLTVTVPPEQLGGALAQYGVMIDQRDGDWHMAPRR